MSTELKNYNKKISETSCRVGEVVCNYPNLFTAKTSEDGKAKYSLQIRFPKTDAATKKLFDECIEAAKQNGIQTKFGGKSGGVQNPIRDGDEKADDDETYAGMWYVNASSTTKPGIAMLENGVIVDALDEEDVYPGCYVVASVNFYAYNFNGKKGVACGLNNVLKTRDGQKLGGSRSVNSDFGDLASDLLD